MVGYSVTIKDVSKELTARERIMLKDTGNAIKIDEALAEGCSLTITPESYAVLQIHNEKSTDNKDYENYIILSDDGQKYVTGSTSFWNSFIDIWNEMNGEPFTVEVYKRDSKNYKGKQFITCSIV